jgi:chromosome segregation ATPase
MQLTHRFEYSEDALDDKTKKLNEQLTKVKAELASMQKERDDMLSKVAAADVEHQQCDRSIKEYRAKKTCAERNLPQLLQSEHRAQQLIGERNTRQQHQCESRNFAYDALDRPSFM